MRLNGIAQAVAGISVAFGLLSSASAAEIRLARQFSMGYLQLDVMEHQQLIEKHAKALGLNDVKVSWFTFNGPTAVNEARQLRRRAAAWRSGGRPRCPRSRESRSLRCGRS